MYFLPQDQCKWYRQQQREIRIRRAIIGSLVIAVTFGAWIVGEACHRPAPQPQVEINYRTVRSIPLPEVLRTGTPSLLAQQGRQ